MTVPDSSASLMLTKALVTVTSAGPIVSRPSAEAVVTRLRRSVAWADRHLAYLSGLNSASARVEASTTFIVNRAGAINAASKVLSQSCPHSPIPRISHLKLLRTIGVNAMGLWDPLDRQRLLIAPNVLQDTSRFSLDQGDLCKWVALRTGLIGVLFEEATFLAPMLISMSEPGVDITELIGLFCLIDAVSTVAMERLTPADLSSIRWLTSYADRAGQDIIMSLCSRSVGVSPTDVSHIHAAALQYARTVLHEASLADILTSPDTMPRVSELFNPSAWLERVRIS